MIVSGHNLGTAPIENIINEHEKVIESAVVGFPHEIKGNALYAYVTTYDGVVPSANLTQEIKNLISKTIGPIAKPDKIQFVKGLPKTRSGKIMRRILRKIAVKDTSNLGDVSTLLNPEVVQDIIDQALFSRMLFVLICSFFLSKVEILILSSGGVKFTASFFV